jgi:mycofactocin precursor
MCHPRGQPEHRLDTVPRMDTPTTAVLDRDLADATTLTTDEPMLIVEELLVEEISIDGMCGVY